MQAKFKLIFKGSFKGAFPLDHLQAVAQALKGLFSAILEKSPPEMAAFFKEFRPLFLGIEAGSSGLLFGNLTPSQLSIFESEKWFWGEVYEVFEALSNGHQKTRSKEILKLARLQTVLGTEWKALEAVDLIGKRTCKVAAEKFREIISALKKEPFEEEKVLVGTIKKVDTRAGERMCLLRTILGESVKVSYPPRLEEEVCRFLRKSVRAYGTAKIDPSTYRIVSFELRALEPYGVRSLEDLERIRQRKEQSLEKFKGVFRDVASELTGEEVTRWQKEALWGTS